MATKLEHVKSVNKILQCADSNYLYVHTAGSVRLDRINNDGVISQGYSFPAANYIDVVVAISDGILLAVTNDVNNKYHLWRSADSGITFSTEPVFLFGDTDGTISNQIPNVKTLGDRSFCIAEIDGSPVVLLGEYNVAAGNEDGVHQTTDQLRFMRSNDLGLTWTEVARWNDVIENTRHIHCVKQHDFTGDIYIAFGDSDVSSGIIRWDGVSVLPSNLSPSGYGLDYSANGFSGVGGAQRYRICDLLFCPAYFVTMSDTSITPNERGVWIVSNDMGTYDRVNLDVINYTGHAGFFGLKTSTGNMYFTEILSGDIADAQMNIWGSSNGGYTWEIIGKYGCRHESITRIPRSFFERQGKIYLSVYGIADNLSGDYYTELVESGVFKDPIPVNLYPVYYVAPDGNDTNGGMSAENAWATLKYAMEGDRLTHGARVKVLDGNYDVSKISPDWDTATRPGTGIVVIEGAGKTKTNITIGSTDYAFWIEENEKIIFKDISLLPTKDITISAFFQCRANSAVNLIDCEVGDLISSVNALIRLSAGSVFTSNYSDIYLQKVVGCYLVSFAEVSTFVAKYSKFFGSGIAFNLSAAASSISVLQSIITDYATLGAYINAVGCSINIKNNIFVGAAGSTASIHDKKAHVITDNNIDGNCYAYGLSSVLYVANNGGSHSVEGNPLLLDTLKISSTSPCLNAGVQIPETYGMADYFGSYSYFKNNIGIDQRTGMPKTARARVLDLSSDNSFF